MAFQLDLAQSMVKVNTSSVPFYKVRKHIWFDGNKVAAILEYKQPANAIWRHFSKPRHAKYCKSLQELLDEGLSQRPSHLDDNDRKAKWINEPGVYKLAFNSEMPAAQDFPAWISIQKCQLHRTFRHGYTRRSYHP